MNDQCPQCNSYDVDSFCDSIYDYHECMECGHQWSHEHDGWEDDCEDEV